MRFALNGTAAGRAVEDLGFEPNDGLAETGSRPGQGIRALLRERWAATGSTFIWKMPWFGIGEDETDAMMRMVRKHSALILDLRDNPGGMIESLENLAGWFFDHRVAMATPVGRKVSKPLVANAHRKPFEGKLIVLVDSRSASAAELFARVMQIERRGVVIGDRTAGTVMESRYYLFHFGIDPVIRYGAAITRADLIMRDGKSLENAGVTPNELILPKDADLAAGRDPALARAAEIAGTKLDAAAAGKLFPYEWAPLQ